MRHRGRKSAAELEMEAFVLERRRAQQTALARDPDEPDGGLDDDVDVAAPCPAAYVLLFYTARRFLVHPHVDIEPHELRL